MVKPTLDWAARQAYSLVKDGSDNLVWDGGTMRRKDAARRDVDRDVEAVETEWANGCDREAHQANIFPAADFTRSLLSKDP